MTIIPETTAQTESFLKNHPGFAALLSNYTYDRLQSRDPDQPLFQLQELLDFAPLEKDCADYHSQHGPGCKPTHSVPKLLRTLLVKYFYDYSLRETEFHIRYNLLIKSFVGYAVFDDGPDHSTISRFENYLILHYPRLFFDTVLNQIDDAFPDDRTCSQIGDTFAMHANAALESLIKRLRHTTQELLFAYRAADPEAYEKLWSQLDRDTLFGASDEKTECYLSPAQRRERLLATVDAALDCLRLIRQTAAGVPSVQTWIARLEKILNDELHLEQDEDSCLSNITLLTGKKRGQYRICSATDPDATIRNHGPGKKDFGYNVSVATTTDFVREIQVDTGSRPDAAAIPELLQTQQEHHDVCPDKFVYDQAAGHGKTAHLVEQATNGRTQLVAKPMSGKRKEGRFAAEDFALSDDGLALTCPNKRVSRRKYRSGSGDGHNFRFIAAQCLGCPFLQPCRDSQDAPMTHKMVFISAYRAEWNRLVEYSKTEAFAADMKLRPQVERVISGLVLHNGARRAHFRGLEKVDFQAKMCATAYNLKRWVSLLSGKRHKKRRQFGAPAPSQSLYHTCSRILPRTCSGGEVGLVAA